MRYLVLSDIHANLTALEAVIEDAANVHYDAVISLGDVVGYGNRPEECVQLLKELRPVVTLLGNHDELLPEPSGRPDGAGKGNGHVEPDNSRRHSQQTNE